MMAKFNIGDIKGVIPALITIFDKEENLDTDKLKILVNYLINQGVHGFYLTGSTGQGMMMDAAERKSVEAVVEEVDGRVPIIVHVGAIATVQAIDLAKHACRKWALTLSLLFLHFTTSFHSMNYMAIMKNVASSTPLPMIIYSIPYNTGVRWDRQRRTIVPCRECKRHKIYIYGSL